MPFLSIFSADTGSREFQMSRDRVIFGRDPKNATICINEPTVSRLHATLYFKDGRYFITDTNSKTGTFLNGDKISTKPLKHGDNIQIGQTVIEFCTTSQSEIATHDPDIDDCTATMMGVANSFKRIPSGMSLSYRIINCSPNKLFHTGDTVMLGKGGMLLDSKLEINLNENIVELDFRWPDGRKKQLLGEIISIVDSQNATCIKLHKVPMDKYQSLLDKAHRGSWISVTKDED